MKQGGFFFFRGQSAAVGQYEAHPYLYAPATGTAKGGESLGEECCLLLHVLHFRHSCQLVHFQLHQSVVLFHPPFTFFGAGVFYGRINAGQFVDVLVL